MGQTQSCWDRPLPDTGSLPCSRGPREPNGRLSRLSGAAVHLAQGFYWNVSVATTSDLQSGYSNTSGTAGSPSFTSTSSQASHDTCLIVRQQMSSLPPYRCGS